MLFVGDDWAEDHHDVELQDEAGRRLARARLPEGAGGVARLHALIGEHLDEDAEPEQVAIGIETDRGPWMQALVAAGYVVYAINPRQVARSRERHGNSGARAYYDELRARGTGHHAALRQLGNRFVGILHGCLKTGTTYDEATAWAHREHHVAA